MKSVLKSASKASEHSVDEKVPSTSQYKVNHSAIFLKNYFTGFFYNILHDCSYLFSALWEKCCFRILIHLKTDNNVIWGFA